MFKIENNKIHLTRGDKATIGLSLENYTFQQGDYIEFRVYNRKSLDKMPIMNITIEIAEETQEVDIVLSPEDTKIGEALNVPMTYWYEIELNNEYTIIGYDEEGAKEFILYPEGVEIDDFASQK